MQNESTTSHCVILRTQNLWFLELKTTELYISISSTFQLQKRRRPASPKRKIIAYSHEAYPLVYSIAKQEKTPAYHRYRGGIGSTCFECWVCYWISPQVDMKSITPPKKNKHSRQNNRSRFQIWCKPGRRTWNSCLSSSTSYWSSCKTSTLFEWSIWVQI